MKKVVVTLLLAFTVVVSFSNVDLTPDNEIASKVVTFDRKDPGPVY
ncbi:hypothetical protein SAMN05421676_102420 [Salinibacillus kushneri]|uniref:Phr family secreted Rap phosphatase inhibitor n=1 Tax=Salinibacillus kushneri TaxID=237682 RepID=A0A1I0BCG4_9BACI|nr:hypothetical protein [Salinibacillus kushneri]SET04502.1 hypothetical protein SAMN05421676_102420 [Salinibacillus kushneri]